MIIDVLDLETTSIDPTDGMIIEIGIASLNTNDGRILQKYDHIVRDDPFLSDPIDKEAWVFQNTSISYDMVMKSSKLCSEWVKELNGILENPILSWNTDFDFSWMSSYGDATWKYDLLPCPMRQLTDVHQYRGTHAGTGPYMRLQEAYPFFMKEEYKEQHRAFDDAYHLAKLIYKLMNLGLYDPFRVGETQ